MPLNANGEGPEIDPSKVAQTLWEVWDANCRTVAAFDNYAAALDRKMTLDYPNLTVESDA